MCTPSRCASCIYSPSRNSYFLSTFPFTVSRQTVIMSSTQESPLNVRFCLHITPTSVLFIFIFNYRSFCLFVQIQLINRKTPSLYLRPNTEKLLFIIPSTLPFYPFLCVQSKKRQHQFQTQYTSSYLALLSFKKAQKQNQSIPIAHNTNAYPKRIRFQQNFISRCKADVVTSLVDRQEVK